MTKLLYQEMLVTYSGWLHLLDSHSEIEWLVPALYQRFVNIGYETLPKDHGHSAAYQADVHIKSIVLLLQVINTSPRRLVDGDVAMVYSMDKYCIAWFLIADSVFEKNVLARAACASSSFHRVSW